MNNENEFTQDGMTFIAEEGEECTGCHFEDMYCVYFLHPCAPIKRADGQSKIWVLKE